MSRSFRRPLLILTAGCGGLLAALSSSAVAGADVWSIQDDVGAAVVSESGMPPFYQSILEQGTFDLHHTIAGGFKEIFLPNGLLSTTNMLGMTNEDLVVDDTDVAGLPDHSVIDVASFGSGYENIYSDLVGAGTGGTNEISDTFVTPFGNFDIPTTFDAAAVVAPEAAAATGGPAASGFGLVPAADVTTYTILPDPEDGPNNVVSVTGLAPLYTTVEDQGVFSVNGEGAVGNASYFTDMFGDNNVLFERISNGAPFQIIDELKLSSGVENIYTDFVGAGANGTNSITDTLITPFGDFNIPTTFDAATVFDASNFAPAAATDWVAALDADWTTLVTDFSALF